MENNNYNSVQIDRLTTEIEKRINDFETGISDKDETIISFLSFILWISHNVAIGELERIERYWKDNIESEAYIAINSRLTSLRDANIKP